MSERLEAIVHGQSWCSSVVPGQLVAGTETAGSTHTGGYTRQSVLASSRGFSVSHWVKTVDKMRVYLSDLHEHETPPST